MKLRVFEPGADIKDVAQQVSEYSHGYAIRFIEGPRSFLNWQAGLIEDVPLAYRGQGMSGMVHETVSFFRLLGFGATRGDAIDNARKNKFRRAAK